MWTENSERVDFFWQNEISASTYITCLLLQVFESDNARDGPVKTAPTLTKTPVRETNHYVVIADFKIILQFKMRIFFTAYLSLIL